MDRIAASEGARAFATGLPRTANPFDPDSENWMSWRDGFEQARAGAPVFLALPRLAAEPAGTTGRN